VSNGSKKKLGVKWVKEKFRSQKRVKKVQELNG